jgi:hypothetical protein
MAKAETVRKFKFEMHSYYYFLLNEKSVINAKSSVHNFAVKCTWF